MADSDEQYFVSNIAKARISEAWRVSKHSSIGTALVVVCKLLRLPFRVGPPISTVPPLEIELSDLPQSVTDAFSTPLQACEEWGFEQVLVNQKQEFSNLAGYAIHLLSSDTLVTASLIWASAKIAYMKSEVVICGMNSRRRNGEMITTSNYGCGLDPPPSVDISRMPGASVAELVVAHRKRIANASDVIPFKRDDLSKDMEDYGRLIVEFNVRRGLYVPATTGEIRHARSKS